MLSQCHRWHLIEQYRALLQPNFWSACRNSGTPQHAQDQPQSLKTATRAESFGQAATKAAAASGIRIFLGRTTRRPSRRANYEMH